MEPLERPWHTNGPSSADHEVKRIVPSLYQTEGSSGSLNLSIQALSRPGTSFMDIASSKLHQVRLVYYRH